MRGVVTAKNYICKSLYELAHITVKHTIATYIFVYQYLALIVQNQKLEGRRVVQVSSQREVEYWKNVPTLYNSNSMTFRYYYSKKHRRHRSIKGSTTSNKYKLKGRHTARAVVTKRYVLSKIKDKMSKMYSNIIISIRRMPEGLVCMKTSIMDLIKYESSTVNI
jgi:hypothetical protein